MSAPRTLKRGDRVKVVVGHGLDFDAVVLRREGPEPHYYVTSTAGRFDYLLRRSELRALPRRKKESTR